MFESRLCHLVVEKAWIDRWLPKALISSFIYGYHIYPSHTWDGWVGIEWINKVFTVMSIQQVLFILLLLKCTFWICTPASVFTSVGQEDDFAGLGGLWGPIRKMGTLLNLAAYTFFRPCSEARTAVWAGESRLSCFLLFWSFKMASEGRRCGSLAVPA